MNPFSTMALNAIRRLTPAIIEKMDAKKLDRYIRANSGEAIDADVDEAVARAREEMAAGNWPTDTKRKMIELFDELPRYRTGWK